MKALLVVALLAFSTGCAATYTTDEPTTDEQALAAKDEEKSVAKAAPAPRTEVKKDTATEKAESESVAKVVAPTTAVTALPDTLEISWNRATITAEYSLDLHLKNGQLIAPCEDVSVLRRRLTFTFRGVCLSDNTRVEMADILDFRICSAENGDWSRPICTNANWDQASAAIHIEN